MIARNSRIVGYLTMTIVQIAIAVGARNLLPLLALPLLLFALLEELK